MLQAFLSVWGAGLSDHGGDRGTPRSIGALCLTLAPGMLRVPEVEGYWALFFFFSFVVPFILNAEISPEETWLPPFPSLPCPQPPLFWPGLGI